MPDCRAASQAVDNFLCKQADGVDFFTLKERFLRNRVRRTAFLKSTIVAGKLKRSYFSSDFQDLKLISGDVAGVSQRFPRIHPNLPVVGVSRRTIGEDIVHVLRPKISEPIPRRKTSHACRPSAQFGHSTVAK